MGIGERRQHVRWVPAVRVVGPVAGQDGEQIASLGAFLVQSGGEALLPIGAVGVNRKVIEVDDVCDVQVRGERSREIDSEA